MYAYEQILKNNFHSVDSQPVTSRWKINLDIKTGSLNTFDRVQPNDFLSVCRSTRTRDHVLGNMADRPAM